MIIWFPDYYSCRIMRYEINYLQWDAQKDFCPRGYSFNGFFVGRPLQASANNDIDDMRCYFIRILG